MAKANAPIGVRIEGLAAEGTEKRIHAYVLLRDEVRFSKVYVSFLPP